MTNTRHGSDQRRVRTIHRLGPAVCPSRAVGREVDSYFDGMNRDSGFTLIELIVTVSVLGVLLAFAIPSFVDLIRDSQRSSAVNDLLADMSFARSEADRRGRVVTVCSNVSGDDCGSATDWGTGWMVFEDTEVPGTPADGARTGTEPVIRRAAGRVGKLTVSGGSAQLRFKPFNKRTPDNQTIKFCDPRGAAKSRAIIVAASGVARVDDADANGNPLVCP